MFPFDDVIMFLQHDVIINGRFVSCYWGHIHAVGAVRYGPQEMSTIATGFLSYPENKHRLISPEKIFRIWNAAAMVLPFTHEIM